MSILKNTNREIRLFPNDLLFYEALNGLWPVVLKKRLNKKRASSLAKASLGLGATKKVNFWEAFELAIRKNLSVYDASYLILSNSLGHLFLLWIKGWKN